MQDRYEYYIDSYNILTKDEIRAAASAIVNKDLIKVRSVEIHRILNEEILDNVIDSILTDSCRIILRAPSEHSEAGSKFVERLWEMQENLPVSGWLMSLFY